MGRGADGLVTRARAAWLVTAGVALGALAPSAALAHGGAYQPPPAPTDAGGASGPTTGGGTVRGPITPGGGPTKGPSTPPDSGGGDEPPPPSGGGDVPPPTGDPGAAPGDTPAPPARMRGKTGMAVVDFNDCDWARWWFANRLLLLTWDARRGDVNDADLTPSGRESDGPDWRERARAALRTALRSDDESLASAAAVALGKAGDAADSTALARVLADRRRDVSVREGAALGLGMLPACDDSAAYARETLTAVASTPEETARLRAMCVYGLGMRREAASLPFLVDVAVSGGTSWDVPAAGVAALGLAADDMTLPELLDLLDGPRRRKGREAVRRAYAAQALAMLHDERAIPGLIDVAFGEEEHARRAAVLALGTVAREDDDRVADVLLHLLCNSRDVATRCCAAIAVGRQGNPRAESALLYGYRKGTLTLRPFAAIGLGLLARHDGLTRSTRPLLHDLAERNDVHLRAALCVAVGLAGERRAAPALREIVAGDDPAPLRAYAALALGLVGTLDEDAPTLRALLDVGREPDLQREAALALGILGDREAIRTLALLVRHGGSTYVEGTAAVAIGRIGGRNAAEALLELLDDAQSTPSARAMGAVGLGLVLDRSDGRALARLGSDLSWWLFTPTVLEILSIH